MAEPLPVGVNGYAIKGRGRPRLAGPEPIPVELWHDPMVRQAMATREIGYMFRYLQRHGISQRRIAALTGQSQSEISEILAGRQVKSVDVLERIADGLGVPRSWLGLAGDNAAPPVSRELVAPVHEPVEATARPDPLADDPPVIQLAVRAFVAGLRMSDALEPFRDH